MPTRVISSATCGIDAVRVTVEVHISSGMNRCTIVGLPDPAVRESYARVRSALANCGHRWPYGRVTVNLSPADVKKEGSGFDLPMALGVLHAIGKVPEEFLEGRLFIGELLLDGTLAPIRGALSISSSAKKDSEIREIIVPVANANEAAAVHGVRVIGASHLLTVMAHISGRAPIAPAISTPREEALRENFDFAEVRGQGQAKRALEVAAAGGHNLLMVGPPGSGKTMLARRLPSILPRLSVDEAIETTKIHSVAGMLPPGSGLVTRRPFRAPHHTISNAGLVGGGTLPRPGEVSMAHHGVLFLDELPEFRRDVLEVLRQPMEDGHVTIARAARTLSYPSRFMLAAALNPCPCGYFNDKRRECSCGPQQTARYLAKISGPLLDRIDLQVEVAALSPDEISSSAGGEPSEAIRSRVEAARARQRQRFTPARIDCNAEMSGRHVRKYCALDDSSRKLLDQAIERLCLSARAYDRILKVARTIADLDDSDEITTQNVAEAVQYRALDRSYFKS